eukprot:15462592-Alexandrium_andersonii.AAC.1
MSPEVLGSSEGFTAQAAVAWGLADLLHVMHNFPGPWLAPHHAQRFHHSGSIALTAYAKLAIDAKKAGVACWGIKPKMHLTAHLLDTVLETCLHPGRNWAFADEDFNGRMVKMAFAVYHPCKFSAGALERYRISIMLSLVDG